MSSCFTRTRLIDAGCSVNFDPVFFDKFMTRHHYLGGGANGSVYGPISWNNSKSAIKQVMFENDKVTDEVKRDIETKKDFWTSLEHKHLIRIHFVDLNQLPKAMFIVMEFAAGGSLKKSLESLRSLSSEDKRLPICIVRDWSKQIAEGMLYLHEKNIVHRDIKSSNILLMAPFDFRNPKVMPTLKIADLDEIKVLDHTTTVSFRGTFAYMAPEVIKTQRFSKASDVWSYGVLIWEMLSGDIPHKGLAPQILICKSINEELGHLQMEQSFPEWCKQLLKKCWESNSKKRPSFQDICSTLNDRYLDPILIKSITTVAAKLGNKSINGITILDKELFIVSEESSEIEIYDLETLIISHVLNLKELIRPLNITSCKRNKFLYIVNDKGDQSNEILRVDQTGKLKLWKWSTGGDCTLLAVTDDSNVISTVSRTNKLNGYTSTGRPLWEINLSMCTGCSFPFQALKLSNGNFVVSHGLTQKTVCVVNEHGQLLKSFGEKCGSFVYLAVDGNGFVLVADQYNNRVLELDTNLEFRREIRSENACTCKCEFHRPSRILLDESSKPSRMLVADKAPGNGGRVLVFDLI